jgi:hypothetical protein
MEIVQMLQQASIVALLSILVSTFPLFAGLYYLLKPSEQRLAFMRPVSLAGLFAALAGTTVGFMNVLRYYAMNQSALDTRIVAIGTAESLVTLFVAFGSLTVAWLCVAIGFRRTTTP